MDATRQAFFAFLDRMLLRCSAPNSALEDILFEWIIQPVEGLCLHRHWVLSLLLTQDPLFHGHLVKRMTGFFHNTGRNLPWSIKASLNQTVAHGLGTAKIVSIFFKAIKVALVGDLEKAMAHVQEWVHGHMDLWQR